MKKSALGRLLFALSMGCAQAVTCNVSSSGLAFGLYNPNSAANKDSTGTIAVSCDAVVDVKLSLSVGNGTGASYSGGRKMTASGGAGTLAYNVYVREARTAVFGNGTDGSAVVQVNGSKGFSRTVYGRIPGSQLGTRSGSYTDTLVVTIEYF